MTEWVRQMVNTMGYIGLALLTFIENIFPPIPSEVIMPLGGYMAAQGHLNLLGVILAGTVGSLIGAVVLYYVGKLLNEERMKRWADEHGGWLLLTKGDVEDAFDWFERHGSKAVFFCRLIPGVRSLISLPAGACGMSMLSFLLYTALGTAIWSGLLAFGGQQLGQRYTDLSTFLQWATYVVVGLLVLSIGWWAFQKRQERREGDDGRSRAS